MRFFTIFLRLCASTATASVLGQRQLNNAKSMPLEGFKLDGLLAMNDAMHKWVDAGHGSHVVTLLSRHGRIVDHAAYGVFDSQAATKISVKKDSIFRIMSMTKPIVGVAMMMFYEEGKWKLDDPVAKHIPEFANLQVKVCSPGSETHCRMEPAKTQMTMAQLMSHTAGFSEMYYVPNAPTLADIVPPLLQAGLEFQPGQDWKYGPGADIQGYLIERWAGQDLSDFLQEKVLQPLGMEDTGFFVEPSKVSRITAVTRSNDMALDPGDLAALAMLGELEQYGNTKRTSKPVRLEPSGGLYSTAEDYWRFSQMLLNGGEFGGRRYLKPDTVKLMRTNVVEPQVRVPFGDKKQEGLGFGMDFAVVVDQAAMKGVLPNESFFWGGAYGTWFWIDPVNDVVFIGMVSSLSTETQGSSYLKETSAKYIYDALKS